MKKKWCHHTAGFVCGYLGVYRCADRAVLGVYERSSGTDRQLRTQECVWESLEGFLGRNRVLPTRRLCSRIARRLGIRGTTKQAATRPAGDQTASADGGEDCDGAQPRRELRRAGAGGDHYLISLRIVWNEKGI